MFNKTEQKYLISILKSQKDKLTRALEHCKKPQHIKNEKHIERLETKIILIEKMLAKLEGELTT